MKYLKSCYLQECFVACVVNTRKHPKEVWPRDHLLKMGVNFIVLTTWTNTVQPNITRTVRNLTLH